jgi:hypothetical protein
MVLPQCIYVFTISHLLILQLQIPYCGHSQSSLLYNSKYKNYRYNIRAPPSVSNQAYINFLQYHNVSRVALIYGPDSPNHIGPALSDSPFNMKDDILTSKIQLVANIAVPYRLLNKNDKKTVFGLLKNSDARYVKF